MHTYLIVHHSGTLQRVDSPRPLTLHFIQATVGGYAEYVRMARDGLGCMINEDGRILNPPLPDNARYPNLAGNIIFGRIKDGEFVGLTTGQLAVLEGGGSFGEANPTTVYMDRSRTLTDDDLKARIINSDLLKPQGQG